MKRYLRFIGKEAIYIVLDLIICFAVGYGLLVLVYCIPEDWLVPNVEASVDFFTEGDTRPNTTGVETSIGDAFSDAMILMTATYPKDHTVFKEALLGERSGEFGTNVYENFFEIYKYHTPIEGKTVYGRVWHGGLVYIKPLLLRYHYGQIRYLLGIVVLALYVILVYRLTRVASNTILPVVVVTVLADPLAIVGSIMYEGLAVVALLSMICVVSMKERKWSLSCCGHLFMLFGVCTVYLDYFTFPLITWGLPLVLYCTLYGDTKKNSQLLQSIYLSLMWLTGYAGMWISKWLLGSALSGRNLFSEALESAKTRSSHEIMMGASKVGFLEVVADNLNVIRDTVGGLAVILFVLCFVVSMLRKRTKPAYLFIMFVPFVWCFFSMEHAYLHSFFTYRNFLPMVFAMSMVILDGVKGIDLKEWLRSNLSTTTIHK